jgi:hypothetical protein
MAETIKIIDAEVTRTLASTIAQASGRRRWPVPRTFKKYKETKLRDPWKFKGIDDKGRTGTWAPNSTSTVGRRWRKQRRFGRLFSQRGKRRQITMKDRTESIMLDSRKLFHSVRLAWSKKKRQFAIKVKGPANKYAFIHLHGNKANLTPARPWGAWTPRDIKRFVRIFQAWWVKSWRPGGSSRPTTEMPAPVAVGKANFGGFFMGR